MQKRKLVWSALLLFCLAVPAVAFTVRGGETHWLVELGELQDVSIDTNEMDELVQVFEFDRGSIIGIWGTDGVARVQLKLDTNEMDAIWGVDGIAIVVTESESPRLPSLAAIWGTDGIALEPDSFFDVWTENSAIEGGPMSIQFDHRTGVAMFTFQTDEANHLVEPKL